MENKKNQKVKKHKNMVDIRILEGTRDLRKDPYEKIGYRVLGQITHNLYYVK